MGRAPCCDKVGLKKGAWTAEEDEKLISFIQRNNGHGSWRTLPEKAGLQRCGKSCRLRWTNYLRPDIKRGSFSPEEERKIIQLHALVGNKWASIATHLPGRTDNEIKNHWHTQLAKRLSKMGIDPATHLPKLVECWPYNTSLIEASILRHMVQWQFARLEAEARSRSYRDASPHIQQGTTPYTMLQHGSTSQGDDCSPQRAHMKSFTLTDWEQALQNQCFRLIAQWQLARLEAEGSCSYRDAIPHIPQVTTSHSMMQHGSALQGDDCTPQRAHMNSFTLTDIWEEKALQNQCSTSSQMPEPFFTATATGQNSEGHARSNTSDVILDRIDLGVTSCDSTSSCRPEAAETRQNLPAITHENLYGFPRDSNHQLDDNGCHSFSTCAFTPSEINEMASFPLNTSICSLAPLISPESARTQDNKEYWSSILNLVGHASP